MALYEQDLKACFLPDQGLPSNYISQLRPLLRNVQNTLINQFESGDLPLLHLPHLRKDLEDVKPYIQRFQDDFSDVVILGTGGSSLGGQAICALSQQTVPRLHFLDNIDPLTFETTLGKLNPHTTGFLVISKSGSTAETILQFLLAVEHWKNLACEHSLKNHFLVITENTDNPLRQLANHWHMPCLDHDPHVGGRFSCLSLVGLFPALLLELDAIAIREGAKQVLTQTLQASNIEDVLPAQGAAIQYGFNKEKQYNMTVLMPYVDRLQLFTGWYRQLWAESIGKNGLGTTPINALGAVDQHSQLQLYLDGPRDKLFTIITTAMKDQGAKLTDLPLDLPSLELYRHKSLGDLIEAEQQATIQTLIQQKCPTRVLHIPALHEESLGALLMHFMLETIFTAGLYQINPYDQPAVEHGKKIAHTLLQAYS